MAIPPGITVSVTGVKSLDKALKEFGRKMERKTLNNASKAAIQQVVRPKVMQGKSHAPEYTGALDWSKFRIRKKRWKSWQKGVFGHEAYMPLQRLYDYRERTTPPDKFEPVVRPIHGRLSSLSPFINKIYGRKASYGAKNVLYMQSRRVLQYYRAHIRRQINTTQAAPAKP